MPLSRPTRGKRGSYGLFYVEATRADKSHLVREALNDTPQPFPVLLALFRQDVKMAVLVSFVRTIAKERKRTRGGGPAGAKREEERSQERGIREEGRTKKMSVNCGRRRTGRGEERGMEHTENYFHLVCRSPPPSRARETQRLREQRRHTRTPNSNERTACISDSKFKS